MSENSNEKLNKKSKPKKEPFTMKKLVKMGFHVWRQFDDPYYAGFAAQIAYFFFMSSVPILIVLTQVLGIFDVSMDFVKEWLETHLSTQMGSFLSGLFSASSTALTNVLMIILALWAASSLEFSLSRLTTYTLTRGRYRFNFFVERAKAIPMALLSLLAIAFSLIVYVYGETLADKVLHNSTLGNIIVDLRTPLLALVFFVMILANYYIVPRIKVPIRAVMPGSIISTVGIMIITWLYSAYTSRAVNYNVLYGTFSTIVAMLLWFYLISWVLCIGMMFNKSWDIHMKRQRLTDEKLHKYIVAQYGKTRGEDMWRKLYIGEEDVFDPSLDSIAVKFSRRYDPGYNEKRERELREFEQELAIRKRITEELMAEEESDDNEGNDNGRA